MACIEEHERKPITVYVFRTPPRDVRVTVWNSNMSAGRCKYEFLVTFAKTQEPEADGCLPRFWTYSSFLNSYFLCFGTVPRRTSCRFPGNSNETNRFEHEKTQILFAEKKTLPFVFQIILIACNRYRTIINTSFSSAPIGRRPTKTQRRCVWRIARVIWKECVRKRLGVNEQCPRGVGRANENQTQLKPTVLLGKKTVVNNDESGDSGNAHCRPGIHVFRWDPALRRRRFGCPHWPSCATAFVVRWWEKIPRGAATGNPIGRQQQQQTRRPFSVYRYFDC